MSSAVDRPDPIGATVGNYTILRKLSTGGMGSIYYAEHALIGRSAAIKVLHPELSGSKEIVNRFFNEAKATTSIKHPGIVEVFDYGYLPGGDGYIIMEHLEGMSLARRLKTGGHYGEGHAAMLLRGVCSALAAAHAKGIVHRDLKPDNIFLVPDPESPIGERPKVLDFGIAKLTDIGVAGEATKTGAIMGTPTYMSPEQCRGTGQVDHRADLYSLGCILYELCCGRPPFKNLGAGELIGAHQHLKPSPPSRYNPGISAEMEALVVCLLDKNPANRVQSAPELAHHLARIAIAHGYQITVSNLTPMPGVPRIPAPSTGSHGAATDADALSLPSASSFTELAPEIEISHAPPALGHGVAQRTVAPRKRPPTWMLVAGAAAALAAGAIAFVTVDALRGAPAAAPPAAPASSSTASPSPAGVAPPSADAAPSTTASPSTTPSPSTAGSSTTATTTGASSPVGVTTSTKPPAKSRSKPPNKARVTSKPAGPGSARTAAPAKPAEPPAKPKPVGPIETEL